VNLASTAILLMVTISISGILWSVYAYWKSNYGHLNQLIDARLAEISLDGKSRGEQKKRIYSKNKKLDAWLRSYQVVNTLNTQLANLNWSMRVDEFLGLIGLTGLLVLIGCISTGLSFIFSLGTAGFIASLPIMVLKVLAGRRQELLERQLPNALDFISRAMQAGHTFVSSLQMAGTDSPEPIGPEFQAAFREISFGKSVQDAMSDLAQRIDCPEMRYFAVAVFINHEVGGNLANLLSGVAQLIRERIKMRESIYAMTGEARTSAWILGSLPFFIVFLMLIIRPGFISVLWTDPSGRTMLRYALALMIGGIFWMHRLSKLKY
jgi:tight adherence protein B